MNQLSVLGHGYLTQSLRSNPSIRNRAKSPRICTITDVVHTEYVLYSKETNTKKMESPLTSPPQEKKNQAQHALRNFALGFLPGFQELYSPKDSLPPMLGHQPPKHILFSTTATATTTTTARLPLTISSVGRGKAMRRGRRRHLAPQRANPALDPPQRRVLLLGPHSGKVGRDTLAAGEAVEHGGRVGGLARRGLDGARDELGRVFFLREEVVHDRGQVDGAPPASG